MTFGLGQFRAIPAAPLGTHVPQGPATKDLLVQRGSSALPARPLAHRACFCDLQSHVMYHSLFCDCCSVAHKMILLPVHLVLVCHLPLCSCPPGTEGQGVGQGQCEPCAVGSFREDRMSGCVECVTITPNTVTLGTGAANRTTGCVCKPGYYALWNPSGAAPQVSSSGDLCTRCPADSVNCSAPGVYLRFSIAGVRDRSTIKKLFNGCFGEQVRHWSR